LPTKVANGLGLQSPIVLITKISSLIHMIDPFSLLVAEMNAVAFWKAPFRAISSASQLVEYTVIDVTPTGKTRGKWLLADVEIARSSDFGANDTTFHTTTHLGSLLHPGDLALGYDVHSSNFNEDDLVSLKGRSLPDVVLVKKVFPNRKSKHKKRIWQLKRLEVEEEGGRKGTEAKVENEYEEFLRDLEEDPELRSGVIMYKAPGKAVPQPTSAADSESMADIEEEDSDFADVTLDELVEDVATLALDEDMDST